MILQEKKERNRNRTVPGMQRYDIRITETLSKIVTVKTVLYGTGFDKST